MKKSDRFKPIAQIAATRETHAAREVNNAQVNAQDKQSRLDQLKLFYQEYVQQYEQQGKTGFGIKQLQSYRSFLEDLNKAIEQQKTLVQIAQRMVHEKKQHWFEARKKVKIYEKVITNFQQDEQYQEDKQEQSAMDEHAQNTIRHK